MVEILKMEMYRFRVDGRKRRFSNSMKSYLGSRLALQFIRLENVTCGCRLFLNTEEKISFFENTWLRVDELGLNK